MLQGKGSKRKTKGDQCREPSKAHRLLDAKATGPVPKSKVPTQQRKMAAASYTHTQIHPEIYTRTQAHMQTHAYRHGYTHMPTCIHTHMHALRGAGSDPTTTEPTLNHREQAVRIRSLDERGWGVARQLCETRSGTNW